MDKKYERPLTEDEKTRKRHDDYLEWWLSDKDKKKKGGTVRDELA